MVLCGVVLCGVVWCGVVLCYVVWCGVVNIDLCFKKANASISCFLLVTCP